MKLPPRWVLVLLVLQICEANNNVYNNYNGGVRNHDNAVVNDQQQQQHDRGRGGRGGGGQVGEGVPRGRRRAQPEAKLLIVIVGG